MQICLPCIETKECPTGGSKAAYKYSHGRGVLALLGTLFLLSACSSVEHADLVSYVNQVKARKPSRIAPLPEFKTYESYVYSVEELRSPFEFDVGATITAPTAKDDDTGLKPDFNRNREALEAFPLDTLTFSGHLEKDGQHWAIITAPDELVYRVQEGNYMGQNYGRIHTISEAKIELTELVQDGLGKWFERESSLALSE